MDGDDVLTSSLFLGNNYVANFQLEFKYRSSF